MDQTLPFREGYECFPLNLSTSKNATFVAPHLSGLNDLQKVKKLIVEIVQNVKDWLTVQVAQRHPHLSYAHDTFNTVSKLIRVTVDEHEWTLTVRHEATRQVYLVMRCEGSRLVIQQHGLHRLQTDSMVMGESTKKEASNLARGGWFGVGLKQTVVTMLHLKYTLRIVGTVETDPSKQEEWTFTEQESRAYMWRRWIDAEPAGPPTLIHEMDFPGVDTADLWKLTTTSHLLFKQPSIRFCLDNQISVLRNTSDGTHYLNGVPFVCNKEGREALHLVELNVSDYATVDRSDREGVCVWYALSNRSDQLARPEYEPHLKEAIQHPDGPWARRLCTLADRSGDLRAQVDSLMGGRVVLEDRVEALPVDIRELLAGHVTVVPNTRFTTWLFERDDDDYGVQVDHPCLWTIALSQVPLKGDGAITKIKRWSDRPEILVKLLEFLEQHEHVCAPFKKIGTELINTYVLDLRGVESGWSECPWLDYHYSCKVVRRWDGVQVYPYVLPYKSDAEMVLNHFLQYCCAINMYYSKKEFVETYIMNCILRGLSFDSKQIEAFER